MGTTSTNNNNTEDDAPAPLEVEPGTSEVAAAAAAAADDDGDHPLREKVSFADVEADAQTEAKEEEGDTARDGDADNNNKKKPGYVTWESRGESYHFHGNPMRNCVWILLVLKGVQNSLNLGTIFINPGFLTGAYNPDWSPGFSSSKANTFISGTQALNSSLPFIVALVADFLTGDYW